MQLAFTVLLVLYIDLLLFREDCSISQIITSVVFQAINLASSPREFLKRSQSHLYFYCIVVWVVKSLTSTDFEVEIFVAIGLLEPAR